MKKKETARKYGYARVSTGKQNEGRQLETLAEYVKTPDRIRVDKASGKDFDRPEYQRLKKELRAGDELYIKSLDRLGRNKAEVKEELTALHTSGVIVHILDIPTTMQERDAGNAWIFDMINNLLVEVLGTMAEQERKNIRQRQREGIDLWKKTGETKTGRAYGRPKINVDAGKLSETLEAHVGGKLTAKEAYTQLGISKASFFRYLKAHKGS